jgi:hypothetical protein
MLISESILRRIVREEIEAIDRDRKKLIIQSDEVDEHGGYDIDRPMIPGGKGSHDPGVEVGRMYEDEDDFQQIRLARLRASGVPPKKAQQMSRSKLKHRGKRAGHG